MARVAIGAGGTGGHVLPALEAARGLVARGLPPSDIVFYGAGEGERETVSAAGFSFVGSRARGLRRPLWHPVNLLVALETAWAALRAARRLRRDQVEAVLSMGGYPAVAPALGAAILRRRLVLFEPNAVAGIANRLCARFAAAVTVPFPEFGGPFGVRAVALGPLVRPEIWDRVERALAVRRLDLPAGRTVVGLFGGSQGARRLNDALLDCYDTWRDRGDLAVVQVTGPRNLGDCEARLRALRMPDDAVMWSMHGYMPDMPAFYGACDVLVSRAGASTLAEVLATGTPAVMVPGAFAEAHQALNADVAVRAGAAVVVPDAEADGPRLRREIESLLSDPPRLAAMRDAGRRAAGPPKSAAQRLADLVLGSSEEGLLGGTSRIHIVGIGGAAMSGIAQILCAGGAEVSGSDQRESPVLDRLRSMGVHVEIGHRAGNVGSSRLVVRSTAVRDGNPEVVAARQRGVRVWSRAQALSELVSRKRGLAVAGTHGKTSTTAMLALVLRDAGLDPTFLVGGEVTQLRTNAHSGTGEFFVVEADESDGTFLELPCEAGIVTNVEADHLDHFGDLDRLRSAFARFVEKLPGPRVVCADDPFLRSLRGTIPYGTDKGCAYRLSAWEPRGSAADVVIDTPRGAITFTFFVPARHFAVNATGAAALAMEIGVGLDVVAASFARYRGVERRFEMRGEAGHVRVVDDYAHLPTEVAETIASARTLGGRVVAVFQPHLYSRTLSFHLDFGRALATADHVVVTDVYPAREDPVPGVSGAIVADAVALAKPGLPLVYVEERGDLATAVARVTRPGDIVLTMGAGDVASLADELLPILREMV